MKDNLVQKMEFQVEIDHEAHFDQVAKEIPDIVTNQLENIIENCLQDLKLDKQVFIIDRLVLDLGVLDLSNFKNVLVDRFKIQFLNEIKKQLLTNHSTKISEEELSFSIFYFFITQGARPWWLVNQGRNFEDFAEQAFSLKPDKFIQNIKFFVRRPLYRRRILENFSEDLLINALTFDKDLDRAAYKDSIYSVKELFKRKYRHWNESKISSAFKEIVLHLFLYPNRINQLWKLELAILEAIQENHPDLVQDDAMGKWQNNKTKRNENSDLNPKISLINQERLGFQKDFELLQGFQYYLQNGYQKPGKNSYSYKYQNINNLFEFLISKYLVDVVELLMSLGQSNVVKKRFLETISQELINRFFLLVAPSKRKLMEWVIDVFKQVQEEYKPINQTFINVKKSINEITFELFLNQKLTSINDENYLRLLFRQTARKFGVRYKDLLFFTIKSLSFGAKKHRNFKFYEVLASIYAKDILKNKRNIARESMLFAAKEPQESPDSQDFQSLGFVTNLFWSFAKEPQGIQKPQIKEWLKSKFETISLEKTSDLIQIWEEFALNFEIEPHQFVFFVLVQKHKNQTIHLPSKAFNFYKKKYQFNGVFPQKKPELKRLIETLHANKKYITSSIIKEILQGLDIRNQIEKLDFRLIVNLIHPGNFSVVESYFHWLDEWLVLNKLQSKSRTIYNWFFQLLLQLSKKDFTLDRLQQRTREFLEINDDHSIELSLSNPKKETSSKGQGQIKSALNMNQANVFDDNSSKFVHAFFRIVEILGKEAVLRIFPDAKKFGDKILYQLLTSKYETEFFNLLKKHQFNKEFRDYVLNQAPPWLKKDLLQFINKSSISSWQITIGMLNDYFEKTKWLKLKNNQLVDFIEKTVWAEIFDSSVFSFEELVNMVMQRALQKDQLANKFWEDFTEFKSATIFSGTLQDSSFPVSQLGLLSDFDFLSYVEVVGNKKIKNTSSIQILERILFEFDFPVGHSFEGQQVADFKTYIQKLVKANKKVLGSMLNKVDSPFLLLRFLGLLDEDALKYLILETQNSKGFNLVFKDLETILSFFRIKDKTQIVRFYKRWIEVLIFDLLQQATQVELYARILRVLIEEGLVNHGKLVSDTDWKLFLELVELDEKKSILFFEQLAQFGAKLNQEEKSLDNKKSALSFLEGKNPIQLIYYPSKLSFKEYSMLVDYLFEVKMLNPIHQEYLEDWVKFATHFQSKKYLQMILKLYFLKNMDSISTVFALKARLVPAIISNLNLDLPELRLFLSRLSFMPTLVSGIPWGSPQNLGKVEMATWEESWEDINRKFSRNEEKAQWQEISFQVFLSEGREYFENKKEFEGLIPLIISNIKSIPLNELFVYEIHSELYLELVEIKSVNEIYSYFTTEKDPHFKILKSKKFILTWIKEFFDQASVLVQSQFMALFHKIFYNSFYTENQRINLFLKGFYGFEEAQKALRVVMDRIPEEVKSMYQAYPTFFGTETSSIMILTPFEVLQFFLESGILPKGILGLDQLAKRLVDLKNVDLKKIRILIHANLQSERGKQHFQKLAAFLDETWFLDLIHPKLSKDIVEFTDFLRSKTRLNFLEDLRITQKTDRLAWIATRWARSSVNVKNPLEILLGILEKWIDLVDPELLVEIFETNKKLPTLFVMLKNSSSKLKKILEEESTEEEKEEKKIISIELEPVDYGEGVSIANAGLVLFWPFYGRFFNALGMIGREGMKGEEIRERAIQLLQYIATGSTQFEEWDLTLNKILCGAAPDFPVGTKIELTDEEEELCNKLILGTIYNWEKMRGTRLETFRETFVRRDGMLYRKENRWELIIENKAYDVLLDTLTWNISMINLSWMNTRINVQWR
jgi:hypothetical protein